MNHMKNRLPSNGMLVSPVNDSTSLPRLRRRLQIHLLKKINGQALRAQVDSGGRANRPSDAVLLELQKQRQAAIQSAIEQVKKSLISPCYLYTFT